MKNRQNACCTYIYDNNVLNCKLLFVYDLFVLYLRVKYKFMLYRYAY